MRGSALSTPASPIFRPTPFRPEVELLLDDRLLENASASIFRREKPRPRFSRPPQTRDGVFTLRLTGKMIWLRQPGFDRQPAAHSGQSAAGFAREPTFGEGVPGRRRSGIGHRTDLTDTAVGFDFVVLDDIASSVWPAGNVLAFHVVNTNWLPSVTLWKRRRSSIGAPPSAAAYSASTTFK